MRHFYVQYSKYHAVLINMLVSLPCAFQNQESSINISTEVPNVHHHLILTYMASHWQSPIGMGYEANCTGTI